MSKTFVYHIDMIPIKTGLRGPWLLDPLPPPPLPSPLLYIYIYIYTPVSGLGHCLIKSNYATGMHNTRNIVLVMNKGGIVRRYNSLRFGKNWLRLTLVICVLFDFVKSSIVLFVAINCVKVTELNCCRNLYVWSKSVGYVSLIKLVSLKSLDVQFFRSVLLNKGGGTTYRWVGECLGTLFASFTHKIFKST